MQGHGDLRRDQLGELDVRLVERAGVAEPVGEQQHAERLALGAQRHADRVAQPPPAGAAAPPVPQRAHPVQGRAAGEHPRDDAGTDLARGVDRVGAVLGQGQLQHSCGSGEVHLDVPGVEQLAAVPQQRLADLPHALGAGPGRTQVLELREAAVPAEQPAVRPVGEAAGAQQHRDQQPGPDVCLQHEQDDERQGGVEQRAEQQRRRHEQQVLAGHPALQPADGQGHQAPAQQRPGEQAGVGGEPAGRSGRGDRRRTAQGREDQIDGSHLGRDGRRVEGDLGRGRAAPGRREECREQAGSQDTGRRHEEQAEHEGDLRQRQQQRLPPQLDLHLHVVGQQEAGGQQRQQHR